MKRTKKSCLSILLALKASGVNALLTLEKSLFKNKEIIIFIKYEIRYLCLKK